MRLAIPAFVSLDFGTRPDCESEKPPCAIPPFPVMNGGLIPLTHELSDAIRISAAVVAANRTEWGETPVPISGQGREIAATVGLDKDAEFGRGNHLDHITPLIEVPRHLQPAPGGKPDGQAAVGPVLDLLVGMEDEGARDIGG